MPASDQQRAVLLARQYALADPLFLDTETTGLHSRAEIIEICVLDSSGAVLLDTLVRPTGPIPWDAIEIHGITNELVHSAPPWPEVWQQVEETMRGRYVGIYNADFDMRMMRQSHSMQNLSWGKQSFNPFCIMKLYAQFYGQKGGTYSSPRWQSLTNAARQCGIPMPKAHRALADTRTAMAVFNCMLPYN